MNGEEYVGEPAGDVPKREPTSDACMGKRVNKQTGEFQGYCQSWPGKGTDHVGEGRCSKHGGNNGGAREGAGAPEGNDNATDHGAFKEQFRADLTDAEVAAMNALIDRLQDITGPRAIAAECAAEALMKYKRCGDERFMREARQWISEFNLIPNEDVLEHTGSIDSERTHAFDEETERRLGKLFDGAGEST